MGDLSPWLRSLGCGEVLASQVRLRLLVDSREELVAIPRDELAQALEGIADEGDLDKLLAGLDGPAPLPGSFRTSVETFFKMGKKPCPPPVTAVAAAAPEPESPKPAALPAKSATQDERGDDDKEAVQKKEDSNWFKALLWEAVKTEWHVWIQDPENQKTVLAVVVYGVMVLAFLYYALLSVYEGVILVLMLLQLAWRIATATDDTPWVDMLQEIGTAWGRGPTEELA